MDIAEFVEETLSEILRGIRAAQGKEGGGAIGATGVTVWSPNHPVTGPLLPGYGYAVFTAVEFDVSVVAETSGGGKGALKVWSVDSIEAGGSVPTSTRAECGSPSNSKSLRVTRQNNHEGSSLPELRHRCDKNGITT
jgi:hypothetical protein